MLHLILCFRRIFRDMELWGGSQYRLNKVIDFQILAVGGKG